MQVYLHQPISKMMTLFITIFMIAIDNSFLITKLTAREYGDRSVRKIATCIRIFHPKMAGWNFGGCAGMNIGNAEMPEPILSVSICPFLSHRIRTLCFHNHSIISSSICLSLGWQAFCFVRIHNHYYRSSCFGFILRLVVLQCAVHRLPY